MILFFTASDFTFTTRYIQNCMLFLVWLSLFVLSGAISPLFPSSISDTYPPGGLIFQCHFFSSFLAVNGLIRARMLKWFTIFFSCGPRFVRTVHHDPSILDNLAWHGSYQRTHNKEEKNHGLKVLISYSLFSYHCGITLEINIKRYLKIIQIFSSSM